MSDLIERVEAARRFPTNTCGASRHAAQIGEALVRRWRYPMLTEEPAHCGESILATVAALWEARTEIERLTAERDDLRRKLAEAELDAERYRWLRSRFFAADFAYSDPPVCAIVFRWPESAKISANLDREIDAAMGASNE